MYEEKYQKPGANYIAGVILRKFTNVMLSYPEFMFFAKIVGGLIILGVLFLIFKKVLGLN
jgi:hypothetical protein